MTATRARPGGKRLPPWRDVRVLRWAFQLAVVAVVVVVALVLIGNVQANSQRLGIPTGFDYLSRPSQFPIPDAEFRQTQPVRDAIVVGLGNTLRVSITGIVLATILGTVIGVARLSGNFLLRSLARAYVETLRNIPLLLIIVFSYIGLALGTFPRDEPWAPLGLSVVSNRGVWVPWYGGVSLVLLALMAVATVASVWVVVRWRRSVNERTGAPQRTLVWALSVAVVVVAVGWFASDAHLSIPAVSGRQGDGGIRMSPEYFAILFALVIYTSSHIAEIIRGSIQAVDRGQREAAEALALNGVQRLRFVILPQAFRVALPPLGNQYVNLLKNSTLGAVVSYYELAQVTSISVANGAPPIPSYLLTLGIFVVLSLLLSGVVNVANRRLAVVER